MFTTNPRLVRSLLFLGISTLVFLLFSLNWLQAQADSSRVEGYVYDTNGNPMKNVEVRVIYADGAFVAADTDIKGHYSVEFTNSKKPIRVTYYTQQQVYFPDLNELSGSTTHNISRTQQGRAGVYGVAAVIQLNNDARTAISSSASDDQTKARYRSLLNNVRLEQGAVTDEVTAALLQSLFDETRRRYGMTPQALKTENDNPLPIRVPFPQVQRPTEIPSCMTVETLREMLVRICSNNSPPIVGLSRTDAITLRMKLNCDPAKLPPDPRNTPSPKRSPDRIRP